MTDILTIPARPAFRKPWNNGAHAYTEADTFAAAQEGFKRVRKSQLFHMDNRGEAGDRACVSCGEKLRDVNASERVGVIHSSTGAPKSPDKWSTWRFDPRTKQIYGGQHYSCSWGTLLADIAQL